jgi:hypothetical protein
MKHYIKSFRVYNYQSGLSLVELLISFSLSLLLMSALMTAYFFSMRQYQAAGQLLRDTFELQLISEFMRDRIRMAGFTPCRGIAGLITMDRRRIPKSEPIKAIKAIEWQNTPSPSVQFSSMNAHVSLVRSRLEANQLQLDQRRNYDRGKVLMVADCVHAELVEVQECTKNPSGTLLRLEKPLYFTYTLPFYVSEWEETRFFIGKNKQGQAALWFGSSHDKEELSPYIVDMSVEWQKPILQLKLKTQNAKEIGLDTRPRNL